MDFAASHWRIVPQQDEHWELFLTMMEIVDLLLLLQQPLTTQRI